MARQPPTPTISMSTRYPKMRRIWLKASVKAPENWPYNWSFPWRKQSDATSSMRLNGLVKWLSLWLQDLRPKAYKHCWRIIRNAMQNRNWKERWKPPRLIMASLAEQPITRDTHEWADDEQAERHEIKCHGRGLWGTSVQAKFSTDGFWWAFFVACRFGVPRAGKIINFSGWLM